MSIVARRCGTSKNEDSGFTLIELMISLGLFALIAVAGLALVDGVIGVQGKTGQRLDRLADLQRTMFVLTSDLDQVARGKITGGGRGISFTRAAAGIGGAAVPVRYDVADGRLIRTAGQGPQLLLTGVGDARWRFRGETDTAWLDHWPPSDDDAEKWPRAIEVQMEVRTPRGTGGTIRRVVLLPVRALGS